MRRFILLSLICLFMLTSCGSRGVSSYDEGVSADSLNPAESEAAAAGTGIRDGTLSVDIRLEGGSGKAYIKSPVTVNVSGGDMKAVLVWNSKNYDYMIVDGVRYDNETPGEESSFTVPVKSIDAPLNIIADTTAMSTPHEIEYVIYWEKNDAAAEEDDAFDAAGAVFDEVNIPGLTKTGEVELKYAKMFKISLYGDNKLISIRGGGNYLLTVPKADIPADMPDNVTVLSKTPQNVYLASTSAMDLVRAAGALDNISMCSINANGWYVDEARNAINEGRMIYAGKYRAPDYELLLSRGCDLAIENTMIYHEPAVKEKIEELGIPVMVEMSSYEPHPLGRLEWVRLYGVLFDKQAAADAYYEEQRIKTEAVMDRPSTGKRVAFFHVTASGMINVRRPGDYISRMIDLSGGEYIFKAGDDQAALMSSMNMQMEDFYLQAKDADVLIYNSTIGGEISSVAELIGKNELFADLKAVKNREVYCTSRNFFQQTTGMTQFMNDLNSVLTGSGEKTIYLNRLE